MNFHERKMPLDFGAKEQFWSWSEEKHEGYQTATHRTHTSSIAERTRVSQAHVTVSRVCAVMFRRWLRLLTSWAESRESAGSTRLNDVPQRCPTGWGKNENKQKHIARQARASPANYRRLESDRSAAHSPRRIDEAAHFFTVSFSPFLSQSSF